MSEIQRELPPTPPTPRGFSLTTSDSEFVIEHVRTGMGCLNNFIFVWLAGWTVGCVFFIRAYVSGEKMADGDNTSLWVVLAFLTLWFIVACLLLHLKFTRKCFRLGEQSLRVETRLLFLSWNFEIPRDTILKIRQVKDGGEDEDSFHSWGLVAELPAAGSHIFQKLRHINNFGRPRNRTRSLFFRQPYEQSEWLGIVLARWANVELELCQKR